MFIFLDDIECRCSDTCLESEIEDLVGQCCDATKKCCTPCTRKLTIETYYYNLMACSVLNKRNNNDSVGTFYCYFVISFIINSFQPFFVY